MSPNRKLVIAAQTAAVSVLVVVVYLTLLAPEGSGPLSGVNAPGGEDSPEIQASNSQNEQADEGDADGGADGGADGEGDGEGEGGGEGRRDGERRRSADDRKRSGSDGATALAETRVTGVSPRWDKDGFGGPSDDQYDDAVTALLEKVGSDPPAEGSPPSGAPFGN